MPVFRLHPMVTAFPPVEQSEPDGLLAVGGGLSPEWLLAAYSRGIFPWYEEGLPILWWSPDPRLVLFPGELHVSRRLERTLRQGHFQVRYDTSFAQVIRLCAEVPRVDQPGTWITLDMRAAYTRLHRLGYAHCAEAWRGGRLVGGVYGVQLGKCFFGESMFHLERDASKVAFVHLVRRLAAEGIRVIDCQIASPHLRSFGAREIGRNEFTRLL